MPGQPFAGEQCGRDQEDCGWIELAALTHYPEEIGDWIAVLSVNIGFMHTASLTRLVSLISRSVDFTLSIAIRIIPRRDLRSSPVHETVRMKCRASRDLHRVRIPTRSLTSQNLHIALSMEHNKHDPLPRSPCNLSRMEIPHSPMRRQILLTRRQNIWRQDYRPSFVQREVRLQSALG